MPTIKKAIPTTKIYIYSRVVIMELAERTEKKTNDDNR